MGTNGTGKLRVLQLRGRDFKGLREVELEPKGNVILFAGKPGQGKTSGLELLEWLARDVGDETLVRLGAEKTEGFLQLGDGLNRLIEISKSLDREGKTRRAYKEGGAAMDAKKARAMLAQIFGEPTFHPIKWVELSGGPADGHTERVRKQRDMFLSALGIKLREKDMVEAVLDLGQEAVQALSTIHLSADMENQHGLVACKALETDCYNARKVAHDQAEKAEAVIKGLAALPAKIPRESYADLDRVHLASVQAWQQALGAQQAQGKSVARANALRESIAGARESLNRATEKDEQPIIAAGTQLKAELDATVAQIAELRKKQTDLEARLEERRKELSTVREDNEAIARKRRQLKSDEEELKGLEDGLGKQSLENPETLRARAEAARTAKEDRKLADQHEIEAKNLEALIARGKALDALVDLFRNKLPARLFAQANFPIPGLGLDGEQLTINGVAIHRLGTKEKIELGVSVSMALYPESGLLGIDGCESLGEEGFQELLRLAVERDMQFWATEVCEEPRPGALWMQNGEVADYVAPRRDPFDGDGF